MGPADPPTAEYNQLMALDAKHANIFLSLMLMEYAEPPTVKAGTIRVLCAEIVRMVSNPLLKHHIHLQSAMTDSVEDTSLEYAKNASTFTLFKMGSA